MNTWVLVIWFTVLNGQGTTAVSVPGFTTEQTCNVAAIKARTLKSLFYRVETVCLPQG